ncbi:MAG TPA: radical SAM protein, partial [Xanthobacteraceae bacterium]
LVKVLLAFATTVPLENVHPLQAGILRLRHLSERRPGLRQEHPLVFWPRFLWETVSKHAVLAAAMCRLLLMKIAIECDPNARAYRDQALEPVGDDDDASLDLLTQTTGAVAAVAHEKKIAELTGSSRAHRPKEFAEGAEINM